MKPRILYSKTTKAHVFMFLNWTWLPPDRSRPSPTASSLSTFLSTSWCKIDWSISVKRLVFDLIYVDFRNNAGIMFCPYQLSQDGIEIQFATNYLGIYIFKLITSINIFFKRLSLILSLSLAVVRSLLLDKPPPWQDERDGKVDRRRGQDRKFVIGSSHPHLQRRDQIRKDK